MQNTTEDVINQLHEMRVTHPTISQLWITYLEEHLNILKRDTDIARNVLNIMSTQGDITLEQLQAICLVYR